MLKRHSHYHYAISTYCDELTQLLNNLLDYPIQLTTYLLSCGLLSRLLRYVSGLGFRVPPLTTKTAYEPLGATPRTNTLPFLIPVRKLVLYGSQHHLLLFTTPCSLRHVGSCSSPYTYFAVISGSLLTEDILTDVSRLV